MVSLEQSNNELFNIMHNYIYLALMVMLGYISRWRRQCVSECAYCSVGLGIFNTAILTLTKAIVVNIPTRDRLADKTIKAAAKELL
jgi:hypothetical protein